MIFTWTVRPHQPKHFGFLEISLECQCNWIISTQKLAINLQICFQGSVFRRQGNRISEARVNWVGLYFVRPNVSVNIPTLVAIYEHNRHCRLRLSTISGNQLENWVDRRKLSRPIMSIWCSDLFYISTFASDNYLHIIYCHISLRSKWKFFDLLLMGKGDILKQLVKVQKWHGNRSFENRK